MAGAIKRMNFILSVTIVIFYRGEHNVLPFLHCHCPHFIPPSAKSKSIRVKRELTFWRRRNGWSKRGAPHGTLTDTVTAPGEDVLLVDKDPNPLGGRCHCPLPDWWQSKGWGQGVQEMLSTQCCSSACL